MLHDKPAQRSSSGSRLTLNMQAHPWLLGVLIVIAFCWGALLSRAVWCPVHPPPSVTAPRSYFLNSANGETQLYEPEKAVAAQHWKPVNWASVMRRRPPVEGLGTHWVVVTTVHKPTEPLKRLVGLPGWNVVVVGDVATSTQWSLPGCVYLSIATQKALGYRIVEHLPQASYARKNIGYLYAIEHGARVIYETDDDNQLLQPAVVYHEEHSTLMEFDVAPSQAVVNPYDHFGAPSIWPRGFPVELISEAQRNRTTTHGPVKAKISIQQGLAQLDPDVDAIFRLTRGREIARVHFDTQKPSVVLPVGAFCPFNSQNTVWHASAFWGLLIPVSTTFRVCDIWRGYWAQRLLWDVGGQLCFLPPTAVQHRNAHDYLADFVEEQELYINAGKLVEFLRAWRSSSSSFVQRILDLSRAMVDAGFLQATDAAMTEAWLKDLLSVGYVPPPLAQLSQPAPEPQQRPRVPLSGHSSLRP